MRRPVAIMILGVLCVVPVLQISAQNKVEPADQASPKVSDKLVSKPLRLFNGKNLDGWAFTKFGGQGDVYVQQGRIILELGNDMTGITFKGAKELPRSNYEVDIEAMRVEGSDFFCGLTFPVKKDPCSLIVGGWGGGVCGLSSIDGMDASENETTTYLAFKAGRWYRIKLRVRDDRIEAWIDDKRIVDQKIKGRKISIRPEVELSMPFGIATWQTTAAIRKVDIRKLDVAKLKEAEKRERGTEREGRDG